MVFSQDSNLERGQGGSNKPENGIQSNNFGGLNLIASPLNVPYEDSPAIINADVDVSGNIRKRKGTRLIHWNKTPGLVEGVSCIPFTTGLGYNMLVMKNNTTLSLLEVTDDGTAIIMTKNNVFTADASSVRINYVSTNEIEPRLIITSGVNPPIQLKFVEQQTSVTGAASTTVAFTSASRFANASTSNVIVYKDRVRQTGFSVSYNAGTATLTVSGLAAYTGDATFDIVLVTWQWWAEAYFWLGERFSGSATRSNSPATIDKVIPIPSTLRDNIESCAPTRPYMYPIRAYKSTDFNQSYGFSLTASPANRSEFAFCDGVPYNGQGTTTPSPLFITFGGTADTATSCDAGGNPQITGTVACPSAMPVVFTRGRRVNFNGARGWQPPNVNVYVNGTAVPQNINTGVAVAGYGTSYFALTPYDLAFRLTTATTAFGIEFASSAQVGLNADMRVEVVNKQVQFLGSGANSNRGDSGASINSDGSWIPAYGFGDFCDYSAGSFPTNVAIYQGRLVFSGFLNNSLRVLFSNQYDSVIPGNYFSHYQIDAVSTSATDAFDMTLSSSPDDVTKGLVEWQQSLFLMTRKAVFRIYGGNNSSISNTNRIVVLVSNIGLINSYSLCRTDKSILYLSDTGVFDLSTSLDSSEYVAGDKSLKIRPVFGVASSPAYEALPWLAFDSANKLVYLGYPTLGLPNACTKLFIYNTFRESWTEYYTPGDFNTYVGLSYIDRAKGLQFGLVLNIYRNALGVASDLAIVRTNYWRYLDYCQELVGTGANQVIEVPPYQVRTRSTVDGVHHYAYDRKDTMERYGFRAIPLTDVQDIFVQLETGVGTGLYNNLQFGIEWKKLPNGKIYLMDNPGTNRTLRIYPRLPVVDSDEGRQLYYGSTSNSNIQCSMVFVDNVFKPETGNFTLTAGGSFGTQGKQLNITAALNSKLIVGEAYPCYYYSPTFTQETLAAMKRGKYVYAFFDNEQGMDTFNAMDVNMASGQLDKDIVGYNRQRLNANISLKYEEDDYGDTIYDNYGYNSLMWDDALFDINSPSAAYRRHVLFKEALQGTSYSYQLIIWSYDETTFTLAGYQIMANIRGSRHINWAR